jgi:hypothetical protein
MKSLLPALLTALCAGLPASAASACDRAASLKAMDDMDIGTREQRRQNRVSIHWGASWDKLSREQKLQLLQAHSGHDICATGGPRLIQYFRDNKLVGEAAAAGGVKLK